MIVQPKANELTLYSDARGFDAVHWDIEHADQGW
jgi:hypothetical protein